MTLKKSILAFIIIALIITSAMGFAYLSWLGSNFPGNKSISLKKAIGGKPVNYLVMGSDSRGEENARADTIVIFRVDPKNNLSYLISIPRDLRVNIPGRGLKKINSATATGGPESMIETLKEFTDFDINHYALLNFDGFKEIIDSLGGITINVEEEIDSNEPGYEMHIKKGEQVLTGTEALNYVRFRHDAKGDLGRIERQQLFFRALSNELLSFRAIPKIPSLVKIFAKNTKSDMGSTEMIKLAWALRGLDKDQLITVTLPGTGQMIGGVSYLIPEEEKINSILNDIEDGKKIDQNKFELKLKVLNGDNDYQSAIKMKDALKEEGYNVISTGNAKESNDGSPIVYCRPEDKEKAEKIAKVIKKARVITSSEVFTSKYIDIIVVTGKTS